MMASGNRWYNHNIIVYGYAHIGRQKPYLKYNRTLTFDTIILRDNFTRTRNETACEVLLEFFEFFILKFGTCWPTYKRLLSRGKTRERYYDDLSSLPAATKFLRLKNCKIISILRITQNTKTNIRHKL